MTTTPIPAKTDYAAGYAEGRRAADERVPVSDNPFPRGSQRFHGWNDGHYDERSARCRGNRFFDEAHVPPASQRPTVHLLSALRGKE